VPAKCQQFGVVWNCSSDVIRFSPVIELIKTVTILCPQTGQLATGGGYSGNLTYMTVEASRPLAADAKNVAGWTISVAPILTPNRDPVAAAMELFGIAAQRSVQVFVICTAGGTTP
jgi:hypothetical protein